jgi:hypothetical protein
MTINSIFKIAASLSIAAVGAVNAQTILPGHYAPTVGASDYEAVLFTINADNTITTTQVTNIAYDSVGNALPNREDTLVAVINNSSSTVGSLTLTGNNIFGFEADGIASANYLNQPGWGPTGYEGPNTSFTWSNSNKNTGVVNFTGGLAAGASTYFSLEEAPATVALATGSNVTPVPEPESYAMMLAGLGLFGFVARRKSKAPTSA